MPALDHSRHTHPRHPPPHPTGDATITVPRQHNGWMWDLTIPGNNDHDFYIQAATTAVLVLNCGDGDPEYSTRAEMAGDLPRKYTQGQSTRDPASQLYHESSRQHQQRRRRGAEGIVVSQEGRSSGVITAWTNS
jgi:hypothetical protein